MIVNLADTRWDEVFFPFQTFMYQQKLLVFSLIAPLFLSPTTNLALSLFAFS